MKNVLSLVKVIYMKITTIKSQMKNAQLSSSEMKRNSDKKLIASYSEEKL